jgi:4-hydroxybenzoate-CoA ligase/benzoate-CoA ligase
MKQPIEIAPLALPRQYNATSHFIDRHPLEGRGRKLAFVDDRGSYSYADLAERVNRAGNVLKSLGIGMENRVMLALLDGIDFSALFWGAIKIGAVPVPVNTLLTAADYDYMLRDSRAKALIVSDALYDRFATILPGQPHLQTVVVSGKSPKPDIRAFADLGRAASPELATAPTLSDDVAFWLYSSGSTGAPKGAVHLQGDLVQTAVLYGQGVLGIREDDVVFSAAKLFFAYGLGNAMTFPLHVGASAVLMAERPTPEAVMLRLKQHRPSIYYGVPTLYAAILADATLDRSKGSDRLRICVSAGEALPENVSRRWKERFGVEILDGIGSTEMLHIFLSNRPGDVRYGTTGKAVPGYELRVVDEAGHDAGVDEVGELIVRGASSAVCYWNNRAKSLATFQGAWTRTGDKYTRDKDGYYQYAGRTDDMLKVGGIWVSPFEVESALSSHPQVLEAAVIGAEDHDKLVKPKAFVVLKGGAAGSDALVDELKAYVKDHLAHYKYPRWIEFVAELPKTATGKIQRYKLRQHG